MNTETIVQQASGFQQVTKELNCVPDIFFSTVYVGFFALNAEYAFVPDFVQCPKKSGVIHLART